MTKEEIIQKIQKEIRLINDPQNYDQPDRPVYRRAYEFIQAVDKIITLVKKLDELSLIDSITIDIAIERLNHTKKKEVKQLDITRAKIGPKEPKVRETEHRTAWRNAISRIELDLSSIFYS